MWYARGRAQLDLVDGRVVRTRPRPSGLLHATASLVCYCHGMPSVTCCVLWRLMLSVCLLTLVDVFDWKYVFVLTVAPLRLALVQFSILSDTLYIVHKMKNTIQALCIL